MATLIEPKLSLIIERLSQLSRTYNPPLLAIRECADDLRRLPQMTTLQSLSDEIREINASNGWNVTKPEEWSDTYKVPGVLALIHSEVSEALEAFRKDDGENFVEELADVLIRVLDLVGAFESDFDKVVRQKMAKNRTRGHKHGGKRV